MSQEHEGDELEEMEEEDLTIHTEFEDEEELITQFNELMTDPDNLETAANYLYESLLDEAILGSVFEMHNLIKTGLLKALEGEPEDPTQFLLVNAPDVDVFGSSKSAKINMDCTCPKCEKLVATARFAPHLEKCMGLLCIQSRIDCEYLRFRFFLVCLPGMGRNSSRIASHRIASREGGNYFGGAQSDDEDDADWSGEKRKKKIQQIRTNGTKKNGKSS